MAPRIQGTLKPVSAVESKIDQIIVSLGDRSYPILIGRGILDRLPELLKKTGARGVIGVVTDEQVDRLHGQAVTRVLIEAGYSPLVATMRPGEEQKRLARIEEITGAFLSAGVDRSSAIVALGGGVVGDVAGFAAACYMRGIPYVQVPTTVVAQVDSSVGGKTAVNHPLAKNVIGAFHQPAGVLIDLELLRTLPDRELRAGLAEVIKHGVIADEALFNYMEEQSAAILAKDLDALHYPVRRSCEIKAAVVSTDEREEGVRANLNYGHTFGHAIETVAGYGTFLHGEAISIGMNAAGHLAQALGLVDAAFVERQAACLRAYGLPVQWPELPIEPTLAAMKRDKKVRTGTLKFIVADRIGHVVHRTDVTETQARAALEAVRKGA
jgi:3-dehydroquinate synthase